MTVKADITLDRILQLYAAENSAAERGLIMALLLQYTVERLDQVNRGAGMVHIAHIELVNHIKEITRVLTKVEL